ncbi:phage tail tape measure protein, partial [uncultured Megasphaera sp.]|uniref:phage tail tape measure protein n=1 Tax=uncultured Megasphaera sp. TaxID=165188 RepID=UPI002868CD8C
MSNYVLSATLELKDQFTAQVNKARSGFKGLTETLKSTGSASDAAAAGMGKAGTAAVKAAGQADRAKRAFQGIRGIYEATIRAKDDATAKIQKVKTELNGLKGKTYTVALNIKQNGSLNGLKDKAGSVANGMLLGTSAQMLAGAGIGFGIYDTLKTSMDFSAALSGVKALVPAGEDAEAVMDAVKNKAMELGQATAFGDVDVANGMAELLKAGLSLQEVLNGATKAALDLATAGDLSLPEAAKTMSIMMNVFDLNDASHAADILTGAANASATNVHEMSYAMAEAAAGAKSMGVSFEDTNATLALFAKNGLLGSDAGTSLKTMLSRLVPQTDQAAKDFQRLGLMSEDGSNKFFDATGKLKPMREVAETLKKSLQGMTAEQKQAALYTIFGSDAIRAATFLAQDGAEGIDKMTAAMKRFTASGVAETKMDNLRGDIEQLSGSWENLQILIMDGKGENGLRSFVQEADKLLSHFSGNVEKNGLGIRSILSLIGEGIKDLKDKFLAFDGIGSVLAGGALAVGLKKIYNLAMKVKDVIQGIPKNLPGGTPTGGNGL